jgi:hypothetical protein
MRVTVNKSGDWVVYIKAKTRKFLPGLLEGQILTAVTRGIAPRTAIGYYCRRDTVIRNLGIIRLSAAEKQRKSNGEGNQPPA